MPVDGVGDQALVKSIAAADMIAMMLPPGELRVSRTSGCMDNIRIKKRIIYTIYSIKFVLNQVYLI